jgi:hypothetical protein
MQTIIAEETNKDKNGSGMKRKRQGKFPAFNPITL